MCGIFAYSGKKYDAGHAVWEGLKRLDYRGYDSWGVGVKNGLDLVIDKHAGKIGEAKIKLPASAVAIGHTRWATHGGVNDINAHPHLSSDGAFMLAHNGIVENYQELKKQLQEENYNFKSETDSEVIVALIEKAISGCKIEDAIRSAFKKIDGRNTVIILTKEGKIVAARNGSPMVIGFGNNKEIYFSSDTLSFAPFVEKLLVMENGQMATYDNNKVEIWDLKAGKKLKYKSEENNIHDSKVDKEGYDHFMIKEIYENPEVIKRLTDQDSSNYQELVKAVKKSRSVYAIGSGTAGGAAAQIAFYLRLYGRIPAVSLIGADANEYLDLFSKDDLIIAPSQSGETADVLEILEKAKQKGVKIASFVNMPGSMMTRMSDFKFMANAGPEICVVSTKVYVSQIAWGYLLSKAVQNKYEEGQKNLKLLAKTADDFLKDRQMHSSLKKLAKHLAVKKHIFLLSKYQNLQIIKEGMVKIIETSYLHAHAIPAGDLKHYAITIMEKGVPVVFVISNDKVKKDVINALFEVKTRGAEVIAIAFEKNENYDHYIEVPDTGETSAIMNIVPLQLLSYYLGLELGNNLDKPRNIAKSVTVK
ncbi:MAG: Glucosamine/fructose-6-phosphate aminotransferase, isomerizing [Candidatus Gottesmanbacteria bacterium GW2011_GWC2_39_8]|uniref:Glutamine--fructose-6-phosphate aminotransferase [isomerizing] n=1 Tax=Candidatus Gottesmanbacteria bacterium GW2011_GWC2_39_8 TaxID=1618450 RepID=A0A0G0QAS8_9BACT|nr:MAG: Glucosamine/fructose-6-phosphate aminotransferase, isomerizing [Candidatus Gottesmanbacteria bacterium GW2011_GWC2_39_8]